MKKITYLILLFFTCLSYGQVCEQVFEVEGDDDTPMVLTVNASDLDCAVGTINSITITDAILDNYFSYIFGETYCGEYYSFELDIDGVTSSVCAEDLIGMVITDFTTFTITSADIDDWPDSVYIGVLIEVNFTATEAPECVTITEPVTDSENALNGLLEWDPVAGAIGYRISLGTTPGGTDVLESFDAEDATSYNVPGLLTGGAEYFLTVTAYNNIGDATGCEEYSFTVPTPPTGSTCQDPLLVDTLPYNATGNTSDYFDTLYEGSPGASGCGSTSEYLGGNDAVYAYTATFDGTITIRMTPTATWSGIFVYDSCENIGVNCLAGVANSATTVREIPEFEVINGQTYYIVISTYPSPQTTAYTLNITEDTCVNPTATYTVVSDCANGQQFLVDVNVTDLGSATSLTISDNQGSVTQQASAIGVFTFGPFANATSVIFTVTNDQDDNCFLTSPVQNQAACPPVNDNCNAALSLVVNADFSCAEFTSGTNLGATASPQSSIGVSGTPNNDVWYSFVAESTSHRVTLMSIVAIAPGTSTDMAMAVYDATGGCEGLTFVDTSDPNVLDLTDLVAGTTYYVRVYGWSSTVSSMTFNICVGTPPPPPASDDCLNATAIEVDVMFCDGTNNNGNNAGATDSGVDPAECFDYGENDVWFSFVVPEGTATVDISTEFLGGTLLDTEIALYSGTCDALVEEDCAQDGTVELSNGFSWNSTISDAPVTVGETYYVRVSGYSSDDIGDFCLDIKTNQTLSTSEFESNAFRVYPNPVKDMLNLSYTQNITNVEVFNMLGQQVATKTVNATQGQVDMSNLATGTYLVKVTTDGQVKTLKVIKQ